MNKKIIIIGGIVILIILIVIIVLVNKQQRKSQEQQTIQTQGTKLIQPVGQLDEKIFFPALIESENAISYLGNQGVRFEKYNLDTEEIKENYPEDVYFVKNVKYSPDGQKAILVIQEGERLIYKQLDFDQKKINSLNGNVYNASWAGNNKLIYSVLNGDKSDVYLAEDETTPKLITQAEISGANLVVSPDNKKVILYPQPEGYGQNELYLLDIESKKISQFSEKGLVGAVWSPDNQKILTNKHKDDGSIESLVVYDINLSKSAEFARAINIDKTIWLNSDQLLSVSNISGGDEFNLIGVSDKKITKINTKSQDLSISPLGAENLMLSPDKKTLYFTANDFLYKLKL